MLRQIRQGDVLLVACDEPAPAGATRATRVVLAVGETTGHAHVLTGLAVLTWSVGEQGYVRIVGDRPGTLQHEDHDPAPAAVVAPETTYQVIPQHELGLSGEWRRVTD